MDEKGPETADYEVPEQRESGHVASVPGLDAAAGSHDFAEQLQGLGLTQEQVAGVLALSRDVVERVVWEVVPTLAETIIKEEIRRLTSE